MTACTHAGPRISVSWGVKGIELKRFRTKQTSQLFDSARAPPKQGRVAGSRELWDFDEQLAEKLENRLNEEEEVKRLAKDHATLKAPTRSARAFLGQLQSESAAVADLPCALYELSASE